ncbi:allophanate hydrolase [Litoreibacter ponti]|uniref:Allophanate hydrolase n=1 Tax=Litoreibacter ponti TaxID=1510457 RepID=A0A2T6BER2_9RHOB|nr:biotin-dependent carboxyltransferase family protein [Litoreibacter ponti]PTX54548.1 allophanate hydrolase [Litoreibacter ponti]
MAEAQLKVLFAGPLVTVQDAGRFGALRYGVPASGPMDRLSFAATHAALGQPPGAALEVSLGGIVLECVAGEVSVAIAGGAFTVDHAGTRSVGAQVLTLSPGEKLTIRAGEAGSWCYLAFAGALQVADWMGSAATHALAGFGGGAVRTGDVLKVAGAEARGAREGAIPMFEPAQSDDVRVVMGPQDHHFTDAALANFAKPFTVSEAYDRMGMRLDGPELILGEALSIPSEPVQRGSIQVSGAQVPTVLLADHQTTGGYPKIATVIGPDLDALVQKRQGDAVRFKPVSAQDAVTLARAHASQVAAYLDAISVPRGTLAERLMRENLISGFISEGDP